MGRCALDMMRPIKCTADMSLQGDQKLNVAKGSNDAESVRRRIWNRRLNGKKTRRKGGQVQSVPGKARDHSQVWKDLPIDRFSYWKQRVCLSSRDAQKSQTATSHRKDAGPNGSLRRENLVFELTTLEAPRQCAGAASNRHLHFFLGNCEVRFEGCRRSYHRRFLQSKARVAPRSCSRFFLFSR